MEPAEDAKSAEIGIASGASFKDIEHQDAESTQAPSIETFVISMPLW